MYSARRCSDFRGAAVPWHRPYSQFSFEMHAGSLLNLQLVISLRVGPGNPKIGTWQP